jgi:hypothetical protein
MAEDFFGEGFALLVVFCGGVVFMGEMALDQPGEERDESGQNSQDCGDHGEGICDFGFAIFD